MSYSSSYNQSFTITHAKYLASKVAADLKRIQRFYHGGPSEERIQNYEQEVTELLNKGYLRKVTYGFKRDGKWIEPTLIYTAQDLAQISSDDDDPGRIRPSADISDAAFSSFLIYSDLWHQLSPEQKTKFEEQLPFKRGSSLEPGIDGYLEKDSTYTSGGKNLNRSSVKSIKS